MLTQHLVHIQLNNYAILLIDNEQLFQSPIYYLRVVKIKPFKIYIKIHLTNYFIQFSNLIIDVAILF